MTYLSQGWDDLQLQIVVKFIRDIDFHLCRIPVLPNHGNHDLEPQFLAKYGVGLDNNAQFQSYVSRNPVSINANLSGSDNPLWYSVNVGPAHMIYLSNYADFAVGSDQYNWLLSDLAS